MNFLNVVKKLSQEGEEFDQSQSGEKTVAEAVKGYREIIDTFESVKEIITRNFTVAKNCVLAEYIENSSQLEQILQAEINNLEKKELPWYQALQKLISRLGELKTLNEKELTKEKYQELSLLLRELFGNEENTDLVALPQSPETSETSPLIHPAFSFPSSVEAAPSPAETIPQEGKEAIAEIDEIEKLPPTTNETSEILIDGRSQSSDDKTADIIPPAQLHPEDASLEINFKDDPAAILENPDLLARLGRCHLDALAEHCKRAFELMAKNRQAMDSATVKNPEKKAYAQKKFHKFAEVSAKWGELYICVSEHAHIHAATAPDKKHFTEQSELIKSLILESQMRLTSENQDWQKVVEFSRKCLALIPPDRSRRFEILRSALIAAAEGGDEDAINEFLPQYLARRSIDRELENIFKKNQIELVRKQTPAIRYQPDKTETHEESAANKNLIFFDELNDLRQKHPRYSRSDIPAIFETIQNSKKKAKSSVKQYHEQIIDQINKGENKQFRPKKDPNHPQLKAARQFNLNVLHWTDVTIKVCEPCFRELTKKELTTYVDILNTASFCALILQHELEGEERSEIQNQALRYGLKSLEIQKNTTHCPYSEKNYLSILYIITKICRYCADPLRVIEYGVAYLEQSKTDHRNFDDVKEMVEVASSMVKSEDRKACVKAAQKHILIDKTNPHNPPDAGQPNIHQTPTTRNSSHSTGVKPIEMRNDDFRGREPSRKSSAENSPAAHPNPPPLLKSLKETLRLAMETQDNTTLILYTDEYITALKNRANINPDDKREYNFLENLVTKLCQTQEYSRAEAILTCYSARSTKNLKVGKLLDRVQKKKI